LFALFVAQASLAQETPKVFFTDDFLLDTTSVPTYAWFYGDQTGILEKTHPVSGQISAIVRSFAKNCGCNVIVQPDDADYVVFISRYDIEFRPKLAEKKSLVIKVDGEELVFKTSVRRASTISSDSCKAIMNDWR
jgi:hypothetical protein